MPVTGRQFIDEPFLKGFWFVAAQAGASEYQIAEITGQTTPREIYHANRDTGQLLAFPYHDRRGSEGLTLDAVRQLWARWQVEQVDLEKLPQASLNHFRLVIDPYLEHDHG